VSCDVGLRVYAVQIWARTVRVCDPPLYVAPPPYIDPDGDPGGGGGDGDIPIPGSGEADVVEVDDYGVVAMSDYAEDYFGEDYVGVSREFT